MVSAEDGFIDRMIATLLTFAVLSVIMLILFTTTAISIIHDKNQTFADNAALQLAAGASQPSSLSGAQEVASPSAVQNCKNTCYYVVKGTQSSPVWRLYLNQPLHIENLTISVLSTGIAPWQPPVAAPPAL